jgi:hypothetical protein
MRSGRSARIGQEVVMAEADMFRQHAKEGYAFVLQIHKRK